MILNFQTITLLMKSFNANAFPETISLPELMLLQGDYRRVRSVFNAKTRGTRYTVHRNYRTSSRISFGEGALRNC